MPFAGITAKTPRPRAMRADSRGESTASRSPLNQTGGQFYFEDWSEPLKLDS
jgi:hypothetical protein